MWIVASFDLPAGDRADARRYRLLRKTLIGSGFSFVQESVAWRWCANREQAGWAIARIRKAIPQKGSILFLQMPDASFGATVHLEDGESLPPPVPPDPWLVFS